MALTGISGAVTGLASTGNAIDEDKARCSDIANIMCYCGIYIEEIFGMSDSEYKECAVSSWKKMLQLAQELKLPTPKHPKKPITKPKTDNRLCCITRKSQ